MILATGPAPTGSSPYPPGGYSFYYVDGKGVATMISATPGPPSSRGLPSDPLAGWIHALVPPAAGGNGPTAFRVGVYNSSDPGAGSSEFGLGTTNLSDAGSSFSHRQLPPSHAAGYLSLDAVLGAPGGGTTLLYSMAARNGLLATTIDLIEWSAAGASAAGQKPRVVAALGDAHQPALFGDIAVPADPPSRRFV